MKQCSHAIALALRYQLCGFLNIVCNHAKTGKTQAWKATMINLKHFKDLSLDATEFCFAKSKETTSFTLIEQKRQRFW